MNHIKNSTIKKRILQQSIKIISNPSIGKPMKYERKGTREVYVGSYRLSYAYEEQINQLTFLTIYHKDEQ